MNTDFSSVNSNHYSESQTFGIDSKHHVIQAQHNAELDENEFRIVISLPGESHPAFCKFILAPGHKAAWTAATQIGGGTLSTGFSCDRDGEARDVRVAPPGNITLSSHRNRGIYLGGLLMTSGLGLLAAGGASEPRDSKAGLFVGLGVLTYALGAIVACVSHKRTIPVSEPVSK